MNFTIKPELFYLRVISAACHDDVYFYHRGDLLQHGPKQPHSFPRIERALACRRSLGLESCLEVVKGSSLSSCYSYFRGVS